MEFGNNEPIAIDENGIIIEGHGRYEALKQLGFDEIETIRLSHLNEQQKKAYILAHNRLTMNTDFDFDVLNLELANIKKTSKALTNFINGARTKEANWRDMDIPLHWGSHFSRVNLNIAAH